MDARVALESLVGVERGRGRSAANAEPTRQSSEQMEGEDCFQELASLVCRVCEFQVGVVIEQRLGTSPCEADAHDRSSQVV